MKGRRQACDVHRTLHGKQGAMAVGDSTAYLSGGSPLQSRLLARQWRASAASS